MESIPLPCIAETISPLMRRRQRYNQLTVGETVDRAAHCIRVLEWCLPCSGDIIMRGDMFGVSGVSATFLQSYTILKRHYATIYVQQEMYSPHWIIQRIKHKQECLLSTLLFSSCRRWRCIAFPGTSLQKCLKMRPEMWPMSRPRSPSHWGTEWRSHQVIMDCALYNVDS